MWKVLTWTQITRCHYSTGDPPFLYSDLRIEWVGLLTSLTREIKYFLTIICSFIKRVECMSSQTTAYLLINHVFPRFSLPVKINFDRGTQFTAEIMQEIWKLLGIKAKNYLSYHPIASCQVQWTNQTIVKKVHCYQLKGLGCKTTFSTNGNQAHCPHIH